MILMRLYFFAALDEFNMLSTEEQHKTKMEISLQTFHEVLTSEAVLRRPMITLLLFLNKIDLLKLKLANFENREEFKQQFLDFEGNSDNEEQDLLLACDSVNRRFTGSILAGGSSSGGLSTEIHTHYICALDTSLMEVVFKTVRKTIFQSRMATAGFKF